MLKPEVADFLKKVRHNTTLEAQIRDTDSYKELSELSNAEGIQATATEFRQAFIERNARAMLELMLQQGVIEPTPLTPLSPINENQWSRIAAIDLAPIATQMVRDQEWSQARAASAERRYRRFLYLKTILPEGNASPTHEVDQFWHQHIINTRKYGPDCEHAVGHFLYHSFLSPEEEADAATLHAIWLDTQAAYEALFEEPYEGTIGAALLDRWPEA